MKSLTRMAAAALLMAGIAGCTTVQFDREKVEQNIEDEVLAQTGVVLTEVECPESPPLDAGSDFECEITAEDGTTAIVDVHVEDDEGNMTWQVRD